MSKEPAKIKVVSTGYEHGKKDSAREVIHGEIKGDMDNR